MNASNTNRLRNNNEYDYGVGNSAFRNQLNADQKKFATLPKEGLDATERARHNTGRGNNRGTFSVEEAAEYLGIGRSTLYSLIYANEITSIKIRNRRLITLDEMKNFLGKAQSEAAEMTKKGESYVC